MSYLDNVAAKSIIAASAAEGNKKLTVGSSTTAETGKYFSAIQAVTDTVVTAQTDVTGATTAALSAFTKIPAGHVVPCKCTAITISSGEAIAYIATL